MLPNYTNINLSSSRDIPATDDNDATYENFNIGFQYRDDTDNLNRILEKFELLLSAIGFELEGKQLTLSPKETPMEFDRIGLVSFPSGNSP